MNRKTTRLGAAREPVLRVPTAVAFLLLPVFLGLFACVARMPVLTPDVWWHLATGRLVASSGIPETDPFSYTLAGRSWTVHEWLADRLAYAAFDSGGLLGVVHLRAGLLTAAFAFAYATARLHATPLVALAVLAPAAYASQRNWLDRPQLWTYALAPFLLWLLERQRLRRTRAVFALPLLFCLWVNLHGGFMLGLGLVVLWIAGELVGKKQRAETRPPARVTAPRPASVRPLLAAGALALFAVLLNPNGLSGAIYPLRYVSAGLGESLQEEQAGSLDSPYAWVHFCLLLLLVAVLLRRHRQVPPQHLGLAFVLGWLSMPRLGGLALPLAAERHAPLFLLLGTPLLAWQLSALVGGGAWLDARVRRLLGARGGWIAAGLVGLLGMALAFRALPRNSSPEARLLPGRYPVEAAEWLRENRLPGNLINPYRWGGYLAFELYPEYKVWIDSRGDLYGVERLREYELLHRMPAGSERAVQDLLGRYDANVVVWQLLTLDFGDLQVHPFTDWLLRSGEWRLVFYDRADPRRTTRPAATSAVFLRVHPRNATLLARHAVLRLPPLPRPARRTP